ncbi:hypothetical protein CAEBREN_17940 [Caenorhabditis brenneri]|uniref:Uncharacterized protein n=1 Tax=Caenorhabditis brenneri TaxID=135651 RepID=G0N639_CAEBE|nr:hypothetical protein CAEBREN_17940 [Caenorhabditis brenneri]
MPATPTRPPSTRISRRTSSRSVSNNNDDQPSTSTPSSSTPLNLPPPVAMETDEEVGGRGRSRSNSRGTAATTPGRKKRASATAAAAAAMAPPATTTTDELEKEEDVVSAAEKPEKDVEMVESSDEKEKEKVQPEQPKKKIVVDKRVAYILTEYLIMNRRERDKRELENRKIRVQDVAQRKAAADNLRPLEAMIHRTERALTSFTLEEILQNPKYAVISDLVPPEGPPEEEEVQPAEQPGPSTKTMQPIEVKIEDADGSAAPSTSVLPSTSGLNGENNVERAAKREAHVLARIGELRKNGLWSNSRLPKCVEPERNKTHWDYLLEEVRWMAIDFRTETNHKKRTAKMVAAAIAKQHRDKEVEVAKAAEREIRDKKKMCAGIAKMVRQFWTDVDKFVDVKATEIREARIQKAKNQHLMFMLGQVGELSNVVQEGLVASQSPSIASHEDGDDKEFEAGSDSEDDEQTIANAEKSQKKDDVKKEVDALKDEANADIDDFLFTLPPEYLKNYGLTDEDVQEMKRQKKEQDERRKKEREAPKVVELPDEEPAKEEEKMEVDEEPAAAKPSTSKEKPKQQIQDTSAEDGNGDGRGVLSNVDYLKLNSSNSGERQQELNNIAEEALKFQPKGYTLETTVVNTPVPFLIRGNLREYQLVGLDWMVTLYDKNLNGILADEMGLGKTIQTISLLAHLACSKNIWGPHLIVVPTSVILNWEMEFKKWCPALKILTYFGTAKERAEKRKGWMKPNCFHVCITSYKTVTQDIRSFKQRAWQYLILDEAQNIKNWKSQRWQALLNVRARRRLLLTGTPLQNSLMELWSLMHFLMPTIFSSHDDFKDWFSNPLTGMMDGSVEVNADLIKSLHKVLRPFILRRLKKEVEKQLPAKTEHVIKCSLSKRQRYLYDDFMSRRSTKDNLKSGNMMSVLNIVMQLRKCCNHPNLFEPRPVLAPFVVPKLQVDVPSYLFDIAHQDPEIQEIPEIFNLQKIGYQPQSAGIYSQKKPLVEELEAMQQNVLQEQRIPEVDGFRFNRTTFVTKNPPKVGEESEDEGVRTNGTVPPKVNGTGINGAINGTPSNASTPQVRPKTSTSTPLTIQTATSGFHFIMANTGRSRLDESARMSPPLKRAKITGSSINWSDYVPKHVLEKMEESRKNQLEVVRRRFGLVRAPIVPLEMVALIREEIMSRFPRLVTDPDEKIQETLMDQVELLVQRFGMYVEPVLTDAWQCRPSSSGLPSYIRQNFADLEKDSHSLLLKSSTRFDTQMSISRSLQFPELRLIEYDCGKLQTLATLLRQLYAFKHRCLIFTQMSKMLDVLQTFLSHHGYQYFRLDGTTGVEQRQAMMERFNADPKIFCFILSTRSGGVGVNLTGADTVIFYDSDWNPTMDAQAQDRCHRIGQTRDVSIYRLISERTIEENILRKATEKRKLGEVAIDEAGFTPEFFKKSDNIRDLFAGEDVDVAATEDVPMNQKDVDKALARCEDEVDVKAAKNADAEARLDTAEFDERMVSSTAKSQAEEETNEKYMELIQAMKPIERYAVNLLETQYKPDFEEECKEAEAQIHQKREEWDKNINEALDPDNPENLLNGDEMFNMDNDFYMSGNAAEVRKTKKKPAAAKKPKFVPRARSPSKRKSLVPTFDPYVSYAPLALGSPPDSPRRKPARRSSNVGGTVGRGRPAGRRSVKKEVEDVKDEMTEDEEDVSDYQEDDDSDDDDYKRPRGRPAKRKRVMFAEPEPKNEPPKKQRLAPNTPRPAPAIRTVSKPSTNSRPPLPRPQFNQDLSTGPLSPSSLTSLPAQGPLTLTPRPAPPPVSLVPSTSSASMPGPSMPGPSAGPRIARVPYHPPHNRPSLLPVRVVKLPPRPLVGGAAPGGPQVVRRIITGVGAGGVGRLPITSPQRNLAGTSSGISGIPVRNGPGALPPRQFVVPSGTVNRIRMYAAAAPGTPRPMGPPTVSGSPNKMMYPVRIVQRPVMPPAPIERPGFGIYERPRISLGSRRSRGDFENAPGPSTSRPQPPPPPPPPAPQA